MKREPTTPPGWDELMAEQAASAVARLPKRGRVPKFPIFRTASGTPEPPMDDWEKKILKQASSKVARTPQQAKEAFIANNPALVAKIMRERERQPLRHHIKNPRKF